MCSAYWRAGLWHAFNWKTDEVPNWNNKFKRSTLCAQSQRHSTFVACCSFSLFEKRRAHASDFWYFVRLIYGYSFGIFSKWRHLEMKRFICSRSFGLQNGWQFEAPWLMAGGVARIFVHRPVSMMCYVCSRCNAATTAVVVVVVAFNEDISWRTHFRYTWTQTITHMQDESRTRCHTISVQLMNVERYENHVTISGPLFTIA